MNSAKRVLLSNDKSISGDAMQEAKSLLDGLGAKELSQSLEACVEPKSLKDRAMDQAAFIVYYEEVRTVTHALNLKCPLNELSRTDV